MNRSVKVTLAAAATAGLLLVTVALWLSPEPSFEGKLAVTGFGLLMLTGFVALFLAEAT